MIRSILLVVSAISMLSLLGCEKPPVHANVKDVIVEASIARLGNLVPAERRDLDKCCGYIGVDPKGRKKFTPSEGYWVRLSIDNRKLARASLKNSCGPSLKPQMCEEDELRKKIKFAFSSREFNSMYGKGLTRFILYDAKGDKIDKTDKHDGQRIRSIKREDGIDHFTIGPVKHRPHTVSIFMSTSLQEFKYDL